MNAGATCTRGTHNVVAQHCLGPCARARLYICSNRRLVGSAPPTGETSMRGTDYFHGSPTMAHALTSRPIMNSWQRSVDGLHGWMTTQCIALPSSLPNEYSCAG